MCRTKAQFRGGARKNFGFRAASTVLKEAFTHTSLHLADWSQAYSRKVPRKPTATDCLAALRPDVAETWHATWNGDKTPQDFLAGSGFRAWWRCERNHPWRATINSRTTRGGSGCPYCAGSKPWVGETDLATVAPAVAAEWDDELNGKLRPTDVTASGSKRVWWRCGTCGHQWDAVVGSRHGHGCPACAGVVATPQHNLLLTDPELAAEAVGWDPTKVAPRSGRKLRWRCSEGHTWDAVVINRTKRKAGCPTCAKLKAAAART